MFAPPEVFKTFLEPSPGVAEAIHRAAARELGTFLKSADFLKLQEQSAAVWRALGIDPGLPVVGRLRQLAAVAGVGWTESEKLIFDEPPGEWFEAFRIRATMQARTNDAAHPMPTESTGAPVVVLTADEIAEFAGTDPRTIRQKLEGVHSEAGPCRRWRWDLARPALVAWTSSSRIHQLQALKWPKDPSRLKNPAKNPGRIRP